MIAARHNIAVDEDRIGQERPPTAAPARFVDMHCHCLPNLDDGPGSVADAIALCRTLADDHVCAVIATPHQLGGFEGRTSADMIRRTTRWLSRELVERGIDLAVYPGAEVRVDERITELLASREILTLADAGRHILLELPWEVLIDIEPLLVRLVLQGVHPLLAHPERHLPLLRRPQILRRWLACGTSLQITAASLTGDWGLQIKQAAWSLIEEGGVLMVATDAHDASPTRMTAAFEMIAARFDSDLAHLLCIDNPARVVQGERLVPVHAQSQEACGCPLNREHGCSEDQVRGHVPMLLEHRSRQP